MATRYFVAEGPLAAVDVVANQPGRSVDNAAITYLGSGSKELFQALKYARLAGAVAGKGMTLSLQVVSLRSGH